MTVIEIRPFRNGWKCFEAPGVDAEAVSSRYLLKSRGGGIGKRAGLKNRRYARARSTH